MDCPSTMQAMKRLSAKWPKAMTKLVEDKANGPAVIAMLRHELSGLIAVNPEGGKEARAHAVSPQIEAGNVYLPESASAPWVDQFIDECAVFPYGIYDDQVDAMTQALNRMSTKRTGLGGVDYAAINNALYRPCPYRIS
jgi:predicted phage terminase large subunit-like protein